MIKPNTITSEYIHALQAIYNRIGARGIQVNTSRLREARIYVDSEILAQCKIISALWGVHVYVGADNDDGTPNSVNLNASSGKRTPLIFMRDTLKYTIPKISVRDEDGNYVGKESLGELTLQKIYATNQFNTPGGDPAIRAILRIRELSTIKNRYINAELYPSDGLWLFLSTYNCVGTLTGRRGSKKHVFGFGGNEQNFPKHSDIAAIYRRCLVVREGTIFLMVDQMQAEDWPVSALAENINSLRELQEGVDRHTKLACQIFGLREEDKSEREWKESMERFLGKKTRHANNYDMRGTTMSESLVKEGFGNYGAICLSPTGCQAILDKVNQVDPSVKGVFHAYVRSELDSKRILRTPFGRERQFFGLRAGDSGSNSKIYREAYAYIPQSTVGDNTGFAVHFLSNGNKQSGGTQETIVQEGHDSIIQEIQNNVDSIWDAIQQTIKAFTRTITFHNGIELEIPVEGEIGYDFLNTVTFKNARTKSKKLKDITYQDVQAAFYKVQELKEKEIKRDQDYATTGTSKG